MLGFFQILFRLALAALLAAFFGLEREHRHKPAGLRTNILVGVGSALVMIVSQVFSDDSARIAAGVVTGIGFLGAGLIIQGKDHVLGITTAATIWIVSAIGLAVGIGYYSAAIAAEIIALAVLYLFGNEKVREMTGLDQ
jgi:putative Mg2+ transporter-C (MgtC) family protein